MDQIQEVMPGYGEGFLIACLDAAGQNAERVIHQLLEGTLPGTQCPFPACFRPLPSHQGALHFTLCTATSSTSNRKGLQIISRVATEVTIRMEDGAS